MKKVKSFGLVLMGLLMLGGLLTACGDTTVENAPPLPTVTPGLTPIVPPTTAVANDGTGSGTTAVSNPPTATPGAVVTTVGAAAGCNAPKEIEGVVQAVQPNAVTVNNQTYAYNPQLLVPNDKAPSVGGPIHLSLACQNGQLVVAKIIAQGPKVQPDQGQNQSGPGNDDNGDKGKGKDDGKGKGKGDDPKPHK